MDYKDTDIILQGPIFDQTFSIATCYSGLSFVNKVIVSTWNDQSVIPAPEAVKVITSEYPENGTGNMNLQIVSSQAGLSLCESKYVVKMRTDQLVTRASMYKLNEYYRTLKQELNFDKLPGPAGPIGVIGMSNRFPFHPQDHIFWGHREDIKVLFDIPLMTPKIRRVGNDFNTELRCVIYLGAHYCAKFLPKIYDFLDDHKKYLVDAAPCLGEAQTVSEVVRNHAFKVFPRFDMHWIKYNSAYWYGSYEQQGEYYAD